MIKKFLQKIFKTVSYKLFILLYGKVTYFNNNEKSQKIRINNIKIDKENLIYKIYDISNGRLYTDRIQDTAIIYDNKIVEGASFQLRYTTTKDLKIYNAKVQENFVLKNGTPRILKKLNGSVLSLLTGGAGNKNYHHWMYDVLPRLSLCSKIFDLNEIDFFLLPDLSLNFQNETLDILNIPKHKRLSSKEYRHIKAKKIIVTDHPYVVTNNSTKDILNIPNWINIWLKKNFIKTSERREKKKFYIDRGDKKNNKPAHREISNEDEIREYLLKNNFEAIKLQNIPFSQQVILFNNANIIIGLHGAGLANLVFCKPETKVIELRRSVAPINFENLAIKNNLNYSSIMTKNQEKISIEKLEKEINRI